LPQTEEPPSANEAEVSLFGPGRGEAIAVHLGNGDWILVDSCLDADRRPAALAYLERIGISPAQVVLVVATHWHDDHIGGLAEVIGACGQADFAYSGALRTDEFHALVGAFAERSQMQSSGVAEFAEITRILAGEQRTLKLAIESRRLWSRAAPEPSAEVEALSPCDAAIARSQQALAALLPMENTSKRAVPAPRPNHASVVLSVSVGDARLLLGADLEETADPNSGWTALLDGSQLAAPASVFKVPHHGSPNADQPRVWAEALRENSWALIAPFVRGRHRLPADADKTRILGRTNRAFLTAPTDRAQRMRSAPVQKMLEELKAHPVNIDPPMGQVRLRSDAGVEDGWSVDLFGSAFQLT
jgi:beta-lactamase superfamily II metal-dependent hydrolase